MLKKTITYTDFDGNERIEDFYFNLTKAELMQMETTTPGGFSTYMQRIIDARDIPTLVKEFQKFIDATYGIKSEDGKRFMKSPEILEDFKATEAYSQLYMELISDAKVASEFINGVMPKEFVEKAKQLQDGQSDRSKFAAIK